MYKYASAVEAQVTHMKIQKSLGRLGGGLPPSAFRAASALGARWSSSQSQRSTPPHPQQTLPPLLPLPPLRDGRGTRFLILVHSTFSEATADTFRGIVQRPLIAPPMASANGWWRPDAENILMHMHMCTQAHTATAARAGLTRARVRSRNAQGRDGRARGHDGALRRTRTQHSHHPTARYVLSCFLDVRIINQAGLRELGSALETRACVPANGFYR